MQEAKPPVPPAATPSDRQGVSVSDALTAAIPAKIAARAESK